MKSFTTSALILILLALLLVLVGGFVFLFQAEVRLRDQVRDATAEVAALQRAQATAAAQMGDAVATRDAAVAAVATAETSAVLLEGQLVDSQQDAAMMAAEIDTLSADLATVQADLAKLQAATPAPPQAQILSPEEGDTVPVGDDVTIVVIASDADGLASITVTVDDDELSTFSLSGELLATRRATWETPTTEGRHTITVWAESIGGVTGEPVEIDVSVSDIEARNATIRAEVEAAVVELRGLPLLSPITPTVLTRDALRDRVAADAEEDSPEEMREETLALAAFDFMPRDYDLYNALVDVNSEGILGFYDPETAEFVVVSDGLLLDPSAQWTHAHEFVHALQDQHYELDGLTDDSRDSEARAAIRALAEGEAELVQYLFLFEGDYFSQDDVSAILDAPEQSDSSYLDALPPILISNLAFPYREGLEFVAALYRENGFQGIDDAWANPPQSTEHILHPDRYLAGDPPQIVALAPLTDTLGAGWAQIDTDIMGEFFLREYLDQELSAVAATTASTGWGGDRYAVYWNEAAGEMVMALRLRWDTPADTIEFAESYALYAAALLETTAEEQPDGALCWVGDETICLLAADMDAFVVRAPDLATATAALGAIRP
jgi:hypothetical protein